MKRSRLTSELLWRILQISSSWFDHTAVVNQPADRPQKEISPPSILRRPPPPPKLTPRGERCTASTPYGRRRTRRMKGQAARCCGDIIFDADLCCFVYWLVAGKAHLNVDLNCPGSSVWSPRPFQLPVSFQVLAVVIPRIRTRSHWVIFVGPEGHSKVKQEPRLGRFTGALILRG